MVASRELGHDLRRCTSRGGGAHARAICASVGALASVLVACGGAEPDATTSESRGVMEQPLVAAETWALAAPVDDPFVAEATGRIPCSRLALRLEASWLEVSTTMCNYATLEHRLERELPVGAVVRGQIAWATLAALEPAVGTLALATSDEVVWTHEVAIPGEADIVEVEFAVTRTASVRSSLFFHVRNHGYNTWQLSPLTLDESALSE